MCANPGFGVMMNTYITKMERKYFMKKKEL